MSKTNSQFEFVSDDTQSSPVKIPKKTYVRPQIVCLDMEDVGNKTLELDEANNGIVHAS